MNFHIGGAKNSSKIKFLYIFVSSENCAEDRVGMHGMSFCYKTFIFRSIDVSTCTLRHEQLFKKIPRVVVSKFGFNSGKQMTFCMHGSVN